MRTRHVAIAQLRTAHGVTQQKLADAVQVPLQVVRQWEDGVALPDVPVLPHLAEFFHVSIEDVLGLAQESPQQSPQRHTPPRVDWGTRKHYLQQTRLALWNDDYLEFLVSHVWKIVAPMRMLDYGCGDGFLGKKLLPLLPEGSMYTGVDISSDLLEEAKRWFAKRPYQTEFIQCDLHDFEPREAYDMACCQAVLRHLSDPKTLLRKMVRSLVTNGMVVCIEGNRAFEITGLWVEGGEYRPWIELEAMATCWETELEQGGRDHATGLKLPAYMKDIGLKEIEVRLNDKVCVLDPTNDGDTYAQMLHALKTAQGWESSHNTDEHAVIAGFERRGMSHTQAKQLVASKQMLREYIEQHEGDISIVNVMGLLITFGYKR